MNNDKKVSGYSISVYNSSAVLYNGTAPIEATAGNSEAIRKFIERCKEEHGNIPVHNEHRVVVLREIERAKKMVGGL